MEVRLLSAALTPPNFDEIRGLFVWRSTLTNGCGRRQALLPGDKSVAYEWREHPKLRGRLQPQHPDDVQVLVHDGGPRLTDRRPEAVWVRVVACSEGDVFTGEVLNQPQQLTSVRQGDRVQFVVPDSGPLPLMVRPKYLAERGGWTIHPCNKCGLSELFDAPSDLIAATFPHAPPGQSMEMFTAFCGACGGVQVVESAMFSRGGPSAPTSKKWWQFW